MLQPFEAMLQQCYNAVLRLKPLLRIAPCNITFSDKNPKIKNPNRLEANQLSIFQA